MRIPRGFGFVLSTLTLYLGLPLLGWGVGDVASFFSLPQRTGYALIVGALALGAGVVAAHDPKSVRGGKGQAGKRVARQSVVRVVVTLLLFVAIAFLPFADRRGIGVLESHHAARWVGLVLTGAGWGLIMASGIALGRLYSGDVTLQEDHHLVTSGPYRYIRHPRYLGALMLSFGLPLLFRSWIGLIGGLVFVGVILFRIRDEETFMHREFGAQWEAYRERSWHLIPFVY